MPEEAKAVLIARAAGGDKRPGGGYFGRPRAELTFDIYRADDGWYVFCHERGDAQGNTVFMDRSWDVTNVAYGPPPLDISTPEHGSAEPPRASELRPQQFVGKEAIYSHSICADLSLKQTSKLPPEAAKAILIARGRGIDLSGGGAGRRAEPYEAVVFEVFRLRDGWYVFCHGGTAKGGQTVRIDDTWDVVEFIYGPPFAGALTTTTKP